MVDKDSSDTSHVDCAARMANFVYLIVVTLSAGCGLVVEIVAGRMIAPYLGMSVYTWTAVIAVVLAGFSTGHWVGGVIADYPRDKARLLVAASLLFAGASSAMSLVLIRLVSDPIIALALPGVPTILLITGALFFLPSFFVGIPAPVLTKLAIENGPQMGRTLGAFYAAGAIGSIAGTLAAGFIFISWFGTIKTIFLVTAIYLTLGLTLLFQSYRQSNQPGRNSSHILPIVLTLVFGIVALAAGNKVLAFKSACATESNYYCIRIVDVSDDIGEPARVMVLDNLGHGINLAGRPETLVTPYVEAQNLLTQIHRRKHKQFRAFFIGGGAYSLPRAWLAMRQDAALTIAEIDPVVTETAHDSFWLPRDNRLKIFHGDARRVLSTSDSKYDIVVGDAFHDIAVPQHLVTREFFGLVRTRLTKSGVFLMNVVDNYSLPRLALSVAETLRTSFATVEIWRSNQTGERATFVLAAISEPTPTAQLKSSIEPGLIWQRVYTNGTHDFISSLDPIVLTDDYAPVDRLIGVE